MLPMQICWTTLSVRDATDPRRAVAATYTALGQAAEVLGGDEGRAREKCEGGLHGGDGSRVGVCWWKERGGGGRGRGCRERQIPARFSSNMSYCCRWTRSAVGPLHCRRRLTGTGAGSPCQICSRESGARRACGAGQGGKRARRGVQRRGRERSRKYMRRRRWPYRSANAGSINWHQQRAATHGAGRL